MDESDVEEYVERSVSVIQSSPQMDEANTKAAILRYFLKILDWEIPTNTRLEYPIKAFGKTYKVDYALVLEGTPVAFLEAKGIDTPLTSKHREQLMSYMTNMDVNYGILTNGNRYQFFQRTIDRSDKISVEKVMDVKLQNMLSEIEILKAYTKDAIQTDEANAILNRIHELRRARSRLKNEKEELTTNLTNVVVDATSDVISPHVESQSKQMVDSIIQTIEKEVGSENTVASSDTNNTNRLIPESKISSNKNGNYVVEIADDQNVIEVFDDNNQSKVMANVVSYLIENHDLISEIEPLPYVPGRTKAAINDQPTYPNGEQKMISYHELAGGYYLDTNENSESKKRRIRQLGQLCGLEPVFAGSW